MRPHFFVLGAVGIFLFSLHLGQPCRAEEGGLHRHPPGEFSNINPGATGPGMAVTKASPQFGFQLSEAAWKRLGIQLISLDSRAPFKIPSSALVFYQDRVGVFRFREGWFRLVSVKIHQQTSEQTQVSSPKLEKGDFLAIRGVNFLRVAEMEVFGEASGGHAH